MLEKRNVVIWDLETTGVDPKTCDVVQIAAVTLNAFTFQEVPNSEFNIYVRPPNVDDDDFLEKHKANLDWHASLYKDKTAEDILEKWRGYKCSEKQAWRMFQEYIDRYNTRSKKFTSPIPGGANILNFDMKIYERLNEKYDVKQDFFWLRDAIDVQFFFYTWMENREDCPNSFSMDTMRRYFGISGDGAHDALNDVKVTGMLITRFMKLHRKYADSVNFRNSFINED
jgi:DNA polymerase III epsilon subunit-like protein